VVPPVAPPVPPAPLPVPSVCANTCPAINCVEISAEINALVVVTDRFGANFNLGPLFCT
jgi:hypothetical protein